MRRGRRAGTGSWETEGTLVLPVALLGGIGAVAVFSATSPLAPSHPISPHFLRHLAALAAGVWVAAAAARLPLRTWKVVALPLWAGSLVALAATLGMGHSAGGAQRWLELPGLGVRIQPAELAKLATLLATASLLGARPARGRLSRRRLLAALTLAALPAGLCLLQPDLGNAVLLVALTGLLLFVDGAPWRSLALPAGLGALGVAAYSLLQPYALRRWLGFLDPWSRASGAGFQLVQSFVAFGRGGLLGVGLGDGRQKLFYLPEAHTDFILSVVAEELGLLGVCVVLAAFASLAIAGLRVARRARQRFALLLAFAMTALLTVPAALNAAVVMGLLPTKGLTLPFLSYGRSSLLVSFLALGILLGVERRGAPPAGQRSGAAR